MAQRFYTVRQDELDSTTDSTTQVVNHPSIERPPFQHHPKRMNFTRKQKQFFFDHHCQRLTIPNEKVWNPEVLLLFHSLIRKDSYGNVIISPSEGVKRRSLLAAEGDHIDASKRHENKFHNLDLIQWDVNLCKARMKREIFKEEVYPKLVEERRVFTEEMFLWYFESPPKKIKTLRKMINSLSKMTKDDLK